MLPGTSASGSLVHDTAGIGLFGTTGLAVSHVCPGGNTTTGTASGSSAALFSGTGVLAVFAAYFRKYRFRRLEAEYNSQLTPNDAETTIIQMSYDRDPFTIANAVVPGMTTYVNANSNRFTSWVPERKVPLIELSRSDPADRLWYTSAANTAITESSAIMRDAYQGTVTAVTNSVSLADTVLGNVLYHFSIDLYGFTNVPAGDPGYDSKRLRVDRDEKSVGQQPAAAPIRDKGDSKLELHDFVELTPKSRRVSETPPPSVRVGSRKN
jgi:hypothetical protein